MALHNLPFSETSHTTQPLTSLLKLKISLRHFSISISSPTTLNGIIISVKLFRTNFQLSLHKNKSSLVLIYHIGQLFYIATDTLPAQHKASFQLIKAYFENDFRLGKFDFQVSSFIKNLQMIRCLGCPNFWHTLLLHLTCVL